MELITYKTNISNESALQRIAPQLNQVVGPTNWQLDFSSADKVLTVYAPGTVNESGLLKVLRKAGIKAVNLDDYYAIY